jgi:hypothetical protein
LGRTGHGTGPGHVIRFLMLARLLLSLNRLAAGQVIVLFGH